MGTLFYFKFNTSCIKQYQNHVYFVHIWSVLTWALLAENTFVKIKAKFVGAKRAHLKFHLFQVSQIMNNCYIACGLSFPFNVFIS